MDAAEVSLEATALLERKTDEMQIHCHFGFGAEGIKSDVIPYAESFSSQVMQLGQTGYVADIRLRPDLQIPQPIKGPEFRAVLATPANRRRASASLGKPSR